ncbi:hypothetical protein MnTg03_00618 [bacterium MnTg03]|nr:hypothetical protein MnTg03_00618 [bacterium MnTg03]
MKGQANFRNMAVVCLTILVLGIPGLSYADDDSDFSRIFIFGDSLSDPGNIFAINGGQISTAPYSVIPSAPYASEDGFMFSNGETWAQVFADEMDHEDSGKAALFAPGINGNYAFGGARARICDPVCAAPGFSAQIAIFLGHYGGADSDALYVVQFGGNDVRDALLAAATEPDPADAFNVAFSILQAAIDTTIDNIEFLYQSGARNFLVANVPNLSLAPVIRLVGAEGAAGFFIAMIYNPGLEFGLVGLENNPALSEILIHRIDFYKFTNDVHDAPDDFDIEEPDAPCINFLTDTESGAICEEPDEHIFWDGIHPTAAVHEELGEMAEELFDDDDDDEDDDDDDDDDD